MLYSSHTANRRFSPRCVASTQPKDGSVLVVWHPHNQKTVQSLCGIHTTNRRLSPRCVAATESIDIPVLVVWHPNNRKTCSFALCGCHSAKGPFWPTLQGSYTSNVPRPHDYDSDCGLQVCHWIVCSESGGCERREVLDQPQDRRHRRGDRQAADAAHSSCQVHPQEGCAVGPPVRWYVGVSGAGGVRADVMA